MADLLDRLDLEELLYGAHALTPSPARPPSMVTDDGPRQATYLS
jgi:hypothetical protein